MQSEKEEKILSFQRIFCLLKSFLDGKPTKNNPFPTLFLTVTMNKHGTPKKSLRRSPKARAMIINSSDNDAGDEEDSVLCTIHASEETSIEVCDSASHMEVDSLYKCKATCTSQLVLGVVPMKFAQITKDSDVPFFTELDGSKMFETVFEYVREKGAVMTYWDGSRKTMKESKRPKPEAFSLENEMNGESLQNRKPGPARKLSLEQEFLLVLMKLRLGLMTEDLAFRFDVSPGKVLQTVITWVHLLSAELRPLIAWPSRGKLRRELPDCFMRLYPKVRTIIDCSEIFFHTPSALDVQACLWSDYKHHCTAKFLLQLHQMVQFLGCHLVMEDGHQIFILYETVAFLDILEPGDQVMADRGFKLKTDLAMRQCTLCIPPSAASGSQMLPRDVKETSNIANIRIYVEQAIKRIKDFRILKTQQPILHLPIMNEVICICAALTNLKQPLVA